MNVAELSERAARPTIVVPASERLTVWPQLGALSAPIRVHDPAGVIVRRGDLPCWERARRLLEEPDA